jgi:hypothetical protein
VPEQPAPIFIGALTPGIKQKATSVRLSNPSYGLLESGKVGRPKKNINTTKSFSAEKVVLDFGFFFNFQKYSRRKQAPNRRNLAQSGHPKEIFGATLEEVKRDIFQLISTLFYEVKRGFVDR